MKVERECKIVSKEQVGDAVYMTLEVGDMIRASFRAPGQFVHIRCGEGLLLRRPISVCSCMEDEPDDLLSIVFEVRGEGTRWLAGRELGDSLDVLGLAGNGFDLQPEGRYLLVGGGIGIPPMLGCAQYTGGRATAILGGRSRDKIILEDFFREDCAKVLCATDDGSLGHHGFVDALVRRELSEDRGYDGVLACGPQAHAAERGEGSGGVWHPLPGVYGGADGLRRGGLSGVRLRHGRRQPEACMQGRPGI